jgi:hypothetical protein
VIAEGFEQLKKQRRGEISKYRHTKKFWIVAGVQTFVVEG